MRQHLLVVCDLHVRNVVHCNIKSENMLFEIAAEGSTIRIVVFGLSQKHHTGVKMPMTRLMGISYYNAPEVLRW